MTKTKSQKKRFLLATKKNKNPSTPRTPRNTPRTPRAVRINDRKPPVSHKYPGLFSSIGGTLGTAAGSLVGAPGVGRMLGASAGDIVSKITGFGDYVVHSNSIASSATVPTFVNTGSGMEICHREYLSDIVGSGGFTITGYSLNPGLASTFPWLSKIAANFDEYEMLGLVFEYRPTSGSISTASPALGTVIYATQYDSYDSAFQTKQQMDSYQFSNSCPPFDKMLHAVECSPEQKVNHRAYVRSGPITAGSLLDYDLGVFSFATQGMPSQFTCGELWVTYHVKLCKPNLQVATIPPFLTYSYSGTPTGNSIIYDPAYFTTVWDSIADDGPSSLTTTPSIFVAGGSTTWSNQLIGLNVGGVPGNAIRFYQRGAYHVSLNWTAPAGVLLATPLAGFTTSIGFTTSNGSNVVVNTMTSAPLTVGWLGPATAISTVEVNQVLQVLVNGSSDTTANDVNWNLVGNNAFVGASTFTVTVFPLGLAASSQFF